MSAKDNADAGKVQPGLQVKVGDWTKLSWAASRWKDRVGLGGEMHTTVPGSHSVHVFTPSVRPFVCWVI